MTHEYTNLKDGRRVREIAIFISKRKISIHDKLRSPGIERYQAVFL